MEKNWNGPKPIKIYNGKDQYIFEKEKKVIAYNKKTKKFSFIENFIIQSDFKEYEVFSVLGNIEARKQSYLVCASQTSFAGKILEAKVSKIEKFIYIPSELNEDETDDKPLLQMLDDFLERNPLYYSDKIDLTISFLDMEKKIDIVPKSFVFPYTVDQYCWNYYMGNFFDSNGMNDFIYPVINGFFGARDAVEYKENLKFILIARKDLRRSGMRFLIRGADNNGNVANSVESEELLIYNDESNINILSFIQMRGSIPIKWSQEPSLNLNPPIRPENDFTANCDVFKKHIEGLFNTFGSVCCINLIDQKNDQRIIGDYYNNIVQNYKDANKDKANNLDFAWFDFHAECKKMKYENIKKLFKKNSVHKCLNNFLYTHIKISIDNFDNYSKENKIDYILIKNNLLDYVKKQEGVFRSNCIDSLDRSNVVQSVFGRFFLFKILSEVGLSNVPPSEDDVFKKFKGSFESIFKLLWADHGDSLALAYSGTGAQKSDFVRTGKRTVQGSIQDGYISLKRFYINNFRDGYNQDCHDYFIGALNPKKRIKEHSFLMIEIFFPSAFFIGLFLYLFLKNISLPSEYEFSLKKFIFKMLLFFGSVALIFLLMLTYSKKIFIDTQTGHE